MGKYYCPLCFEELEETEDGRYYCEVCENTFDEEDTVWGEDEEDDENTVPEGCRACGGPYPYCKTSCKIFDD